RRGPGRAAAAVPAGRALEPVHHTRSGPVPVLLVAPAWRWRPWHERRPGSARGGAVAGPVVTASGRRRVSPSALIAILLAVPVVVASVALTDARGRLLLLHLGA